MIAMQYSFTLPADYDMAIIDRRIRDKGPLLDNLPGLRFKAYLSSRKGDPTTGADENRYAPFYVWSRDESLSDFVCGPGFAGLTGDFGRPEVRTWVAWKAEVTADIRKARFATRQILAIAPYASLEDLRRQNADAADEEIGRGALASVAGFEPTHWTCIRFQLWRDLPTGISPADMQIYGVGHVSFPAA